MNKKEAKGRRGMCNIMKSKGEDEEWERRKENKEIEG